MLEFQSDLNSSWLVRVSWIADDEDLEEASFNDLGLLTLDMGHDIYEYYDVAYHVYEDLMNAESPGRHFNFHIRNDFAYKRM